MATIDGLGEEIIKEWLEKGMIDPVFTPKGGYVKEADEFKQGGFNKKEETDEERYDRSMEGL